MTKTELIDAIRHITQDDGVVEAMLRHTTLPTALRMAVEKAFVYEETGPAVETLREATKMLISPGWFQFEDSE